MIKLAIFSRFLCLVGVHVTFRNKRVRIVISLLSTIFVVFASMMFFQSLSVGNAGADPVPTDNNPTDVSNTPAPTGDTTPGDSSEANGPKLTNNQKYFEQLVAPDSTNILVTGSDVAGWNFDTIMIMSIDKTNQTIKLLSLPRDIYIDYSDYVINKFNEAKPGLLKEPGMLKINAVPTIGNAINYKKNVGQFGKPYMDFLCDILDEVFSIHISDYVYVKVAGVRNIIDYFGGVEMNVPILMNYYDPTQNLDIYIEPGRQVLNGKNAEGFLRFRQGYDANGVFRPYGDFYRKENQSKFVQEFIKQKVTLSNLGKLSNISDVITQNVITSVKGWDSIVSYGSLAEEAISKNYKIENVELKCTEKMIDGLDYVLIQQEPDPAGT